MRRLFRSPWTKVALLLLCVGGLVWASCVRVQRQALASATYAPYDPAKYRDGTYQGWTVETIRPGWGDHGAQWMIELTRPLPIGLGGARKPSAMRETLAVTLDWSGQTLERRNRISLPKP